MSGDQHSEDAGPDEGPVPDAEQGQDLPLDLALDQALDRARASARRRGAVPRSGAWTDSAGRDRSRSRRRTRREPFTAAGPDPADPQPVGALVRDLRNERGWDLDLAVGSIVSRWADLVGPEVADHCRPERFEDGELLLVAESSAWATQLRLLSGTVRHRLDEALGPGVVRRIQVRGPTAPSWRKGAWRVVGRGPRDTYG